MAWPNHRRHNSPTCPDRDRHGKHRQAETSCKYGSTNPHNSLGFANQKAKTASDDTFNNSSATKTGAAHTSSKQPQSERRNNNGQGYQPHQSRIEPSVGCARQRHHRRSAEARRNASRQSMFENNPKAGKTTERGVSVRLLSYRTTHPIHLDLLREPYTTSAGRPYNGWRLSCIGQHQPELARLHPEQVILVDCVAVNWGTSALKEVTTVTIHQEEKGLDAPHEIREFRRR